MIIFLLLTSFNYPDVVCRLLTKIQKQWEMETIIFISGADNLQW